MYIFIVHTLARSELDCTLNLAKSYRLLFRDTILYDTSSRNLSQCRHSGVKRFEFYVPGGSIDCIRSWVSKGCTCRHQAERASSTCFRFVSSGSAFPDVVDVSVSVSPAEFHEASLRSSKRSKSVFEGFTSTPPFPSDSTYVASCSSTRDCPPPITHTLVGINQYACVFNVTGWY